MIEIACLIVIGVVTWTVAGDGVAAAAQTFLCALLAGLIAMNFFEPLAIGLQAFLPDAYCDFVALVGLFIVFVFALRMGTEQIAPSYIQVIPAVDSVVRWPVALATGYLTMAFLLTSLHTAPLPREFMGFKPERNNFFNTAPDRQWLGFVQYVSEKPLATVVRYKANGKDVYVPRAFDGRFELVGDPARPYSVRDSMGRDVPQVIWPSFPIRYAARRGGASNPAAAASQQVVAPTNSAPAKPSTASPF